MMLDKISRRCVSSIINKVLTLIADCSSVVSMRSVPRNLSTEKSAPEKRTYLLEFGRPIIR